MHYEYVILFTIWRHILIFTVETKKTEGAAELSEETGKNGPRLSYRDCLRRTDEYVNIVYILSLESESKGCKTDRGWPWCFNCFKFSK